MQHRRGKGRWQRVPKEPITTPLASHLPIRAYTQQILRHIHAHTVTFVQGETGCGKSTGVPQMILDDALARGKPAWVLVVQPCDVATVSLARHVAALRRGVVGEEVGYAVSPSLCQFCNSTRLLYVTPSYLFQWLIYSKGARQNMTHLILDEVHYRTTDQDLLFLLVKLIFVDIAASSACNKKILVMSASLDHSPLREYFSFLSNNQAVSPICVNKIKTIHPLKVIYAEEFLEELPTLPATVKDMVTRLVNFPATGKNIPHFLYDLIGDMVLHQAHSGDVFLIFMPGMAEISQLECTLLRKLSLVTSCVTYRVALLHAFLSEEEHQEVLRCAYNHANIIICTNIAEGSIMIPRVKYVIDFGMEEVVSFNRKRGMNVITNMWCSKTSLRQRAGKVACDLEFAAVFRLFTKKTYESLQEYAETEMKRSCLAQPLLKVKEHMSTFGSVDDLLQQLLDPPGTGNFTKSVNILKDAGAIHVQPDGDFTLTQLGKLTARLSLDVDASRLIMLGLLLGCSVECVIMAAGLFSPVDLFKKPYLRSGFREQSSFQEDELSYFKGKKFYDNDTYSDMIIFCKVYCHWLHKAGGEKQWISKTCINPGGLHLFVRKVQWIASSIEHFMRQEKLAQTMGSEYRKILELANCHSIQPQQISWIFCNDTAIVLLAITGAYFRNVMIGKVPNTGLAQAESMDIGNAGLNAFSTFKVSNVPTETLNDLGSFEEILKVLGPISKILVSKDKNTALVECSRPMEEEQHCTTLNLPEAAQAAYFLASQQKTDSLSLSLTKGSKTKSVCIGKLTKQRQIFWSTYVKGQKYGIKFDRHTNLPQCAFGIHSQDHSLVAVAANFLGADNSKVHVSTSTLLPTENYFSIIALLLFRPFQTYLIRTDSAQEFVYSLQYGPLTFHWSPKYILVQQLHLIEDLREKLNRRMLESQLRGGYIIEDIFQLLDWIASQKYCEPHLNSAIGPWQEYPSFKPVDIQKYPLAWKLNMASTYQSRETSLHIDNMGKKYSGYTAEDTGEKCLLNSFKMINPELENQSFEEWLDGNKELNQVFYSLLERLIADPKFEEQARLVLRFMHKRCNKLVPKKKHMELENWYHTLCNPVHLDGISQITNKAHWASSSKIFLEKQHASQGWVSTALSSDQDYLPMISKTMNLTAPLINTVRKKMGSNASQVKIVLPKIESQSDNIVISGPPSEVEAAVKWIELITAKDNAGKLWQKSINNTHFVPERQFDHVCCKQLGQGDESHGAVSFRGFSQFFVQGCGDNQNPDFPELGLDLDAISGVIKSCLAKADKSAEIEIQARLGRVVFSCLNPKKYMLPFQNSQPLGQLLSALGKKTFYKQCFSDTVTKEDYFYIRACVRLYKPGSAHQEKRITLISEDPVNLGESFHARKVIIKDSIDEPGKFDLLKVQQKERLAVVDIVQLKPGLVRADIRLSVQALKQEQIEDCYRDFVSNIRWDGAMLRFPRGPFDVRSQRIKNIEEYAFDGFSISLNEITQAQGKNCTEKYEVEISPIYCGKSCFSIQDTIENLNTILSNILAQAQTISNQLCLNQASSSCTALAQAILCSWKSGGGEDLNIKNLLLQHIHQDLHPVEAFERNQKQKLKVFSQSDISALISDLVEILWHIDGADFNSINLSGSLLSTLFRSLQSMGFTACVTLESRALEAISRQGFPPRVALTYASMFKCHCFRYHQWMEVLASHLLELMIGEEQNMEEICYKQLNILDTYKFVNSHALSLPFESTLIALGRHWADRNPVRFLRLYSLALGKEHHSPSAKALMQEFVSNLFCRYPSKAAAFVLSSASCYINDPMRLEGGDSRVINSLLRLINQIKDLKLIVTEDCRSSALKMLINLEGRNHMIQEIEKKVFEVYEVDEATFRHCHYQKILSKILTLKAVHLKELERRGLRNDVCQSMELKSWTSGKRVASSCLIPGLNKEGDTLIGSPGIFIPARDPMGQITGAQIKVDKITSGKYKWLSSNNQFEGGKGPNINDEWPLFCCIPLAKGMSILGMCEGGLKAHVLSFLAELPVIGASGAAFPKSRNLLERYLAIINPNQIIFFPDAGSQCNDQVSRCYFQTFRLIRELGYSLLIAWWGQVNKVEHEDIDDLLCNGMGKHNIPLVLPAKFWHTLHPAVRKKLGKEFPEFSGVSELKKEEFTDNDEVKISRDFSKHQSDSDPLYDAILLSIPKQIIKCMPPPPNDMVTPASVNEFTIEIRIVKVFNADVIDSCIEWLLQDTIKSTTCVGLLCQYDIQGNPCLLQLSVHQRCLLIQVPRFVDHLVKSIRLQSLLRDKDVIKTGVEIDKDALHIHHFLHLTTNNCIKISQHSTEKRQKDGLLTVFRTLFKWDWSEKAEVISSDWSLNPITLEQIKYAVLSAWSSHLICAQQRQKLEGTSFSLDGQPHQLLDYFQRSLLSINESNQQNNASFELTGASVELHQGFLILQPSNIRSQALSLDSVVELRFKDGRDSEEYVTKRSIDRRIVLDKRVSKIPINTERLPEPDVDASMISKVIVDNSRCLDMQKQKLEDGVHFLLCNPLACPSHILMAVGCFDTTGTINHERPFQPPRGLTLNETQVDALRMMLISPLSAVIGPPGTGKTTLIAGVAKSWDYSTTHGEVLLCAAQQNVAVRHMAETMIKQKVQGVMLLISQDYYTDWYEESYRHLEDFIVVSGHCTAEKVKSWTSRNKRQAPRILLCTLALIGSRSFYTCLKNCKISYMIIDECSQTAEGALISSLICLPHLQKLSVLGDPCQLPPFGKAIQSVFDLVAKNCKVISLQVQYRMPKCIADFVSCEFYGGKLYTASKPGRVNSAAHCKPLVWVDVCGLAKTGVGSTSLCNEVEAEAIMRFCKQYRIQEAAAAGGASSPYLLSWSSSSSSSSLSSSSSASSSLSLSSLSLSSAAVTAANNSRTQKLVVLTLYEAQRLLINKMLMESEVEGVTVHNVDSFQGQEAEHIVISLVVGERMSPFASDRRRACVLLSRAKYLLYIFGNIKAVMNCRDKHVKNTCLSQPNIWKSLALECEKHHWVAKADNISELIQPTF